MSEIFEQNIAFKYNVYNSIFLTLQFDKIKQTGILLPVLGQYCKNGFDQGKNPEEIIANFFEDNDVEIPQKDQLGILFRFIQYIERQVVLVDALEDASFKKLNNDRKHSLKNYLLRQIESGNEKALKKALSQFKLKIVLTAHPTQFYPESVLGITSDLSDAIENNDLSTIRLLLSQLGKTPFLKRKKPTPFDEAMNLKCYLEDVFYEAIPKIYKKLLDITQSTEIRNDLIQIGFWPGGDRDGNPFVSTQITLNVAKQIHLSLLNCYLRDIKHLKRRLTFGKIDLIILELQNLLSKCIQKENAVNILPIENFREQLLAIREIIISEHNGLFVEEVEDLLLKVDIFGYHFSTLDIRQDSRVVDATFKQVEKKLNWKARSINSYLTNVPLIGKKQIHFENENEQDTFSLFKTIKDVQTKYGEYACHRFIISNCRNEKSVLQVYAMAKSNNWETPLSLDIVPLFETIDDLLHAPQAMKKLYGNKHYRLHLKNRGDRQVIMLGFSDGTKDGGYFAANWGIYKAKEELTKVAKAYGVKVVFFDGRGGPPGRGGGNVQQYYAAQDNLIENKEIQLTIQGQTVSSKFGTIEKAEYYLEQLLKAGISNHLEKGETSIDSSDRRLMNQIAEESLKAYRHLRSDEHFVAYLEHMTPLKYFGATNIASRPSKRGKSNALSLNDLRAIPFVGSWSQVKQNIPGYYGFGNALESIIASKGLRRIQKLYKNVALFRSLASNSMQSLSKCYFPLTAYQESDPQYGTLWQNIFEEYKRSIKHLLKTSRMKGLMEDDLHSKSSIQLREEIVLPLLTIQQYAMIQKKTASATEQKVFDKLIMRCMYGIINAARNSA